MSQKQNKITAYIILFSKLFFNPLITLKIISEIMKGKEVYYEIEGNRAKIYSVKKKGRKK